MTDDVSPSGWRGSHQAWFDAAYESLIEVGIEAVRILPLSKKLDLARTSFYWFFKDREALLAALLDHWRAKNTGNLVARTEAPAVSLSEAILNLFDCWLDTTIFDSRLEFAVRNWAQQSEAVSQEIQHADEARLDAIRRMFLRFGHDDLSADVRARTIYLTQIGYISMKTVETLETRMGRIPSYVEIFTGGPARPVDLESFLQRHSFTWDAVKKAARSA